MEKKKQTVHHEQKKKKINNAMTPKLAHPEILFIIYNESVASSHTSSYSSVTMKKRGMVDSKHPILEQYQYLN